MLACGFIHQCHTINFKMNVFTGALSTALHYPIGGRELTDVLQGLLGKYRAMMMQLQDELLSRADLNRGSVENEMTLEKNLLQLQRDLADGLKEKNLAIEDRERVYEMAELLKAKFATLMEEKTKQTEELAQSREDNVVLAKTLMDKNLEFTAMKEKLEEEIFELASQLMAARNHIAELDTNIEGLNTKISELLGTIEGKEKDMGVLREEITSLNAQLEERGNQLQTEKNKTLELGAELLTLVNRKEMIQKELAALTSKHEETLAELANNQEIEAELRAALTDAENELRHKEEQMFELTKHSAAVELEAKQAKLEADQLALQYREKMLTMVKPGTSNTEAGSVTGAKYDEMQNTIRKGAKVIKDLERSLRRTQADLEETKKEKDAAVHDLTEVREKYRDKLATLLIHDGEAASAAYHHHHAKTHHRRNSLKKEISGVTADGNGWAPLDAGQQSSHSLVSNNNNNSEEGAHPAPAAPVAKPSGALTEAAQLQHQLLDSYAEREAAQAESLQRALQHGASIKAAYRELYDKYRTTMDLLEEQLPKATSSKFKAVEEQLRFAEIDVRN
jgi:chromosome segregation ATPase